MAAITTDNDGETYCLVTLEETNDETGRVERNRYLIPTKFRNVLERMDRLLNYCSAARPFKIFYGWELTIRDDGTIRPYWARECIEVATENEVPNNVFLTYWIVRIIKEDESEEFKELKKRVEHEHPESLSFFTNDEIDLIEESDIPFALFSMMLGYFP